MFTVEAVVNGEVIGHGLGRSKKDAQQVAAREAYEHLTGIRYPNGNGNGHGDDDDGRNGDD